MSYRLSPRARPVALVVASLVSLLAAGCGGGSAPTASPGPFVASLPGAPVGHGGEVPAPPPAPPGRAPHFDADAFPHERVALYGSFPSDVVRHEGVVFTDDADQIEADGATIVAVDVAGVVPARSTRFLPVTITLDRLVDSHGHPPTLAAPIGFGCYLNDLEIASDHLGFALVNAGGSDTDPTLSDLVAFDPTRGVVLQVVDLATVVPSQGRADSDGGTLPASGYRQSQAEAVCYVPTGTLRGHLYVAMANVVFGAPSYGATKEPGTIEVFDVYALDAQPVRARPAGALATETIRLDGYDPVALQRIGSPAGPRLLVTVAGATGYDASYALVPTTPASVEAYDATTDAWLGRFELGMVGLAAARPALGSDRAGHQVGFFPSAVTGEVYLLRLDGLYADPIDATRLAVLRGANNGIPIAADDAGRPGANVTSVGLVAAGRALLVAGFGDLFSYPAPTPGRLYLVALPDDVVGGAGFGTNFVPGWSLLETVSGRALGAMTVDGSGGGRPDAYVDVSGSIDTTTFLGSGPGSLGALWLEGTFSSP